MLFLALLRIVNSPFGRVLQAIRENDFRAEAIGYRTVVYRTLSNVIAALFATLAGALLALWLRYTGPDTTLSFEIMLDILLIVVIGGMGTMYGAALGSVIFVFAQNYLQDLLKLGAGRARRRAGDRRAGVARSLAAVAGRVVRAGCLSLPERHRRSTARRSMNRTQSMSAISTSSYHRVAGRELHVTEWGHEHTGWWWRGTAWRAPGATWTISPRTWRSATACCVLTPSAAA